MGLKENTPNFDGIKKPSFLEEWFTCRVKFQLAALLTHPECHLCKNYTKPNTPNYPHIGLALDAQPNKRFPSRPPF